MPNNHMDVPDAIAASAADTIRKLLNDAYARGVADGRSQVKAELDLFLTRVSGAAPTFVAQARAPAGTPQERRQPSRRIRPGSIPDYLQGVLPKLGSATLNQLREAAEGDGKVFTTDAIRTELRRWEHVRYRENSDRTWSLIGPEKRAERAVDATPSDPQPQPKEDVLEPPP
jgi:hypothetical protein